MTIFGRRGITSTLSQGTFFCPSCQSRGTYSLKGVRRYGSIYCIPVLPLDRLADYVECNRCRETYQEAVLRYKPGPHQEEFETEYQRAIKRVMILMTIADGKVDDEEIKSMISIYGSVANRTLDEQALREELLDAQEEDQAVAGYLESIVPYLTDDGKALIVKAAFFIAAADGVVDEQEKKRLMETAAALQLSRSRLDEILAELEG